MEFSVLYFANREVTDASAEYDLLLDTARFADEHDFSALWMPERHFHRFGGAYPNPALTAAALATVTRNIRLRAGSVVVPLHDPLEVVENWSLVDNLSRGRVDLAFGTGWAPNDFVLAPDRYQERRKLTMDGIDEIRGLWRGEPVKRVNGEGDSVEVLSYPRPMQPEPGLWMTCSSSQATFEEAGARGLNILTALLFQKVEEVAANIEVYRAARAKSGLDPAGGTVTLMMHTFAGESDKQVRDIVKEPFKAYLKSSFDLWRNQWSDLKGVDHEQVVNFAFERYFRTASLFGSVDKCVRSVEKLAQAGVNEVACLVDFGVTGDEIRAALPYLDQVRSRVQAGT
ncbi:MupA/Atu3671 family FMN-dependent luciferase-like monooxygenase [Streptomyces sp. Inha503]|uniref:MupA/Atu3671 family FMN-dependent luciferase-like monooxygenase n=1 Tax=Streptomyces sp. Inha503 TaxID=3383314 RepID=UPI00399F0784